VNVRRVQEAIAPVKDIEGVHPHNLGMLTLGKLRTGPSTAQAVIEIVDAAGIDPRGKEAVVVGHSEIVGKPVALALMERMATVTVCHVATRDLPAHARGAEILVVAVGRPRLITGDMVREGALVIDVGINRVTGADGKSCTVGDVDFAAAAARAGWITPVPGGVGPVTVAVLLRSAVYAALRGNG
jgi:methylenetetrahydrofolate dehydrogenase (NADP+)/methenyltetrahydrofolate cyclohydrolase